MVSRIKVRDIRELQKKYDKVIELEYEGLNIEVKPYLPIEKKINIANQVYISALDESSVIPSISQSTEIILFTYLIVENYSNINLPKDHIEGYNILTQTGIYKAIAETIPGEINCIRDMINELYADDYAQYKYDNKLINVITTLLNNIIEQLPNEDEIKSLVSELNEDIENFDPDKLKFIQDFVKINSRAD